MAGSGKTTTIVEGVKRVPCARTTIFLAFNKAIAEELKSRGVNARTFHSLAYGVLLRHKNVRKPETNKLHKLMDLEFSGDDVEVYGAFVKRLVGLAKQSGVGCLLSDTESNWHDIIDHHGLELDKEGATKGVPLIGA